MYAAALPLPPALGWVFFPDFKVALRCVDEEMCRAYRQLTVFAPWLPASFSRGWRAQTVEWRRRHTAV
jgi:hypothetical protein